MCRDRESQDWYRIIGGNSQVYAKSDGVIKINLNVEVGEAFDPPLSDGFTIRNGTSMDTSHLDPRSVNSGKISRCQTVVFPHLSLTED